MIKRTVEISQQPAHLTVKLDQLLVQPHDQPVESHGSIPCEDLGIVLVDHPRTTYSHAALAQIVEHDAVLIVCGRDHLPAGVLLPLTDHSQVVWRIHDQLSISRPLQKQLWKQLVQAKIRAQAMNLAEGATQRGRLLAMIREVKSNDSSNCESQAARIYWSSWLPPETKFKRDVSRNAGPPNNMLNYGYAVVRAAIARALVASGLLPALGLHHHNRSNAFCLADDLIEPLRPIVDRQVRQLFMDHGRRELDQPTKAGLLEVLTWPVHSESISGGRGPLMVAIQRMVGSLVRCYQGESKTLVIPTLEHDDAQRAGGDQQC